MILFGSKSWHFLTDFSAIPDFFLFSLRLCASGPSGRIFEGGYSKFKMKEKVFSFEKKANLPYANICKGKLTDANILFAFGNFPNFNLKFTSLFNLLNTRNVS